jgi:hypothetical protein
MLYAPQRSEAGRWLRSMSRPRWREISRQVRIAMRECRKATEDAMIFGTGFVRVGSDGEAYRVGADG